MTTIGIVGVRWWTDLGVSGKSSLGSAHKETGRMLWVACGLHIERWSYVIGGNMVTSKIDSMGILRKSTSKINFCFTFYGFPCYPARAYPGKSSRGFRNPPFRGKNCKLKTRSLQKNREMSRLFPCENEKLEVGAILRG